jgi:hypothetical protein
MRVATVIRLLRQVDQQAEVMIEVSGGRRYHARDVVVPGAIATSSKTGKKVIITSE